MVNFKPFPPLMPGEITVIDHERASEINKLVATLLHENETLRQQQDSFVFA